METVIVLIIVAAAFYGAARHFVKLFSGKTGAGCNCAHGTCNVSPSQCHEAKKAFPIEKK